MKQEIEDIRVMYTDVDGTLVNDGCLLQDKQGRYMLDNARAIHLLLERGVDVVMTTSRTHEQLKEVARVLGFQNYICDLGCEIVYQRGQKIIRNYEIPEDHDNLRGWIESSGAIEELFERFEGRVRYYTPWSENVETHPLLVGELDIEKANKWMEREYPGLKIVDNGRVPPEEDFPQPHAYHVLPRGAGKRAAVARDKEIRGLERGELVGIGDSIEDSKIAPEVGTYFSLGEDGVEGENIVFVENEDGRGFSRAVNLLKELEIQKS